MSGIDLFVMAYFLGFGFKFGSSDAASYRDGADSDQKRVRLLSWIFLFGIGIVAALYDVPLNG